MNTTIPLSLVPLVLLLALTSIRAQPKLRPSDMNRVVVPLLKSWQFREVGKADWHSASVPGCVHTDLLANQMIDDPFYRDNEKELQWIGKVDWEYRTIFRVTPALLGRNNIELVFEGLDTYAQVYLNDVLLLSANNMFRTWRVDCKAALRRGENVLRIRFRSPINEVLPLMTVRSIQLPAPNDQGEKTSPYTRKAPYQYGWDWGPRLVTSGIWRPVILEAWDHARISDLHIVTNKLTRNAAHLTATVEIQATGPASAKVLLDNLTNKSLAGRRDIVLEKGINRISFDFTIARPKLWWPNGLGAQPLYGFRSRVIVQGRLSDQKSARTGLRTVELRQQLDDAGKTFTFVINGIPVFAKGGNWIPADSFPSRVTKERYEHLLKSVRDANMNMLRVWGGGIYEPDLFYNLCDQMGILVWQDFMFACSMYPGEQDFLENVRAEAIDNVTRLRNHPSIVLWAGNNEIETGWQNWGWRQSLPASVWDDYKKIFLGVLEQVCTNLDAGRPYWPSSPHGGLDDDPDSLRSGDLHYWRVWHAAEPFTDYETQSPRFMSEYGFQSFPELETVKSYTTLSDRQIDSPVMVAHQRHPRGNQLVREYMLREYPQPKDFESFLYVSQVLQAEGIRIGAEHLRRQMPHNMGSLYWQINDCWPAASWSSIDYYGRWKALQYYARRFYGNLLLSPTIQGENLRIYVVSDLTKPVVANISVTVMDFEGVVVKKIDREVRIAALSSQPYLELPVPEILEGRAANSSMVHFELLVEGKVESSRDLFLVPFKELSLSHPTISSQVSQVKNGFKITLSTDKFAKAVYLSFADDPGLFSDNYFDLIPGKEIVVEYRSKTTLSPGEFQQKLRVRSLVDAF